MRRPRPPTLTRHRHHGRRRPTPTSVCARPARPASATPSGWTRTTTARWTAPRTACPTSRSSSTSTRTTTARIDGGDTLMQTTTTDANGAYLFTGLHPDDYLVQVDTDQPGHLALRRRDDHRRGHGPDHRHHQPARCHHHHRRPGHHQRRLRLQLERLHRRLRVVGRQPIRVRIVDGGETRIAGATVLLYFDADNNGVIEGRRVVGQIRLHEHGRQRQLPVRQPAARQLPGGCLRGQHHIGRRPRHRAHHAGRPGRRSDRRPGRASRPTSATTTAPRSRATSSGTRITTACWIPLRQNAAHLLENVTVTIVCYGADGVPGGTDDKTLSMDTGTGGQPDGHFKFLVPPGPCTLTYETSDTNAKGYPEATTPTRCHLHRAGGRGLAPVVRLRRGQRRQDRRPGVE